MLLKSLELQGFKTFPDKTKLEFGSGVTSIVGPNGSGKSNISDAIRWVLGEQSAKILRCSKMEDVVFNGTTKRKSQGFAEVTLTVDNKDRRLSFDNDTVAVTRRYYRSGESEYLINKTSVRLKDIHELLMDTGLGRDGYSMIGQGKIDEIVSSKPESRREIFEEAAGISKYRYRKSEAQRRLSKAEDNLLRLRDIVAELETRVGPLKIQAKKAKEYLDLSETKRSLEIGIWVDTLKNSDKTLRDQEDKIVIAKNQDEQINIQLENLRIEEESVILKSNMQSAKIDEKRREIENLKDFNNDNNRKIAVYKNDIAHISDDTKRIKDEIKHTDISNTDLNNKIDEKKGKIEWHEKYIKEKSSELGANSNRLKEVEDSIGRFSEESRGYSEKLSEISRERSERNLEYVTSNSSITEINNRLETIKKEIIEKNNDIKETVSALSDYESMESELEIKLESAKNALNGFKMRLESKKNKKEAAKINFDKLNLDRDECERRARLLEDLERNLEGFQKSVKVVLQESSRGRLRGINGPISRLFKTSPDYNIAIETALGAAMQNIVVETSYDAKQAIKYLKQNNAGRCTFLPLDTIKGRELEEGSLEDQFGFVGIASKLCSYDKKYHEVITSLLGRIVVAEDLDSVAGIAKKYLYKFRVVTLDGQVVNAGGSMTGGSSIRNSGLLSRMSEIEKIKKRAQELNKNALDAKEEYKILEQETAKAEAELLAANAEFSNASKEKINIEAQIKIFKTKKASQAETLEAIGREEKNISLRLAELNSRKDKAMAECDKLDVQIKSLELKVSSIMGNKNGLTEKREQIGKKIQDIKIEILSAEKDIESLKFEIASIENQKKDKDGRIENLNLEIKNNEYKIELADQKIKSLSEESKNKSSVIKEKEKEILNLNIQKQELERASIDIRKKEQESLSTRETIGRELARLEERKESLKANYDDIIRRLWEEYELTRREAEEIGSNIKSVSESQKELKIIKFKIKNLGSVNLGAVEEYEEVSERYNFMSEQVEDVEESRKELLKLINDLTSQMKDIFSARFREINENFGSTFRELFGGGSARLLISDPNDILNSGIEIEVQPEGKLISRLESLSGGEKALVAISLYFAIMKVSPAPFCILDEIEAALDDVNVDRFAAYLRRMNKNTQFIAITHRRGTMEGSDALYGVTMQDEGISKILSLDIENAVIEKNAS